MSELEVMFREVEVLDLEDFRLGRRAVAGVFVAVVGSQRCGGTEHIGRAYVPILINRVKNCMVGLHQVYSSRLFKTRRERRKYQACKASGNILAPVQSCSLPHATPLLYLQLV